MQDLKQVKMTWQEMVQKSGVVELTYLEYVEQKDGVQNAEEGGLAWQETELQRPHQKLFLLASFQKVSKCLLSHLISCHQTVKDIDSEIQHMILSRIYSLRFSFFLCLMYLHQEGPKKILKPFPCLDGITDKGLDTLMLLFLSVLIISIAHFHHFLLYSLAPITHVQTDLVITVMT